METLTDEQYRVIECVKMNKNVYICGSAGTGKSYTIHYIQNWANENKINIAITAMTGCAAILLNGSTLHSYLGIGLATKTADELALFTKLKRKKLVNALRALHYLVIDEVSMLDKDLFEKISKYLSILRQKDKPFGDVKLILCGDFCQLPPVKGTYCFKSDLWGTLALEKCLFTKSFRQKEDAEFCELLETLRKGTITKEIIERLYALKDTKFNYGIKPTKLYPLCKNIEDINEHYFNKLVSDENPMYTYTLFINELAKRDYKQWVDQMNIPETVKLCKGCQILITYNISFENQLVNGTRGVITNITDKYVVIRTVDGAEHTISMYCLRHEDNEQVFIEFMPIKLAYALTIHKSQGMTLDAIEVDLGINIFEYGQAYTALSRAKSLSSIKIVNFNNKAFKTHSDVKDFYGYIK